MFVLPDAHVTTIAVDPAWHAPGHRHPAAARAVPRRRSRRALPPSRSRCGCRTTPAQELYRRFGFAPAGVRKGYYADTDEDALVMWAHDIDTAEYADRLDAIAAGIPGGTSVATAGAKEPRR